MRLLKAISDLPWWTGLPIFFIGNTIILWWGLFGFSVGITMCLFGSWIFSKLFNYGDQDVAYAIAGIPIFMGIMPFIAHQTWRHIEIFNHIQLTDIESFTIRAAVGLFVSLMAFTGFRKY